ncbi:STAS domain-containing protein [Streptacidiphilus sp. PB12-B1b]|uniref:STAS domain-containing protein n=1 Tax=Streptacidiphilus sp. PB12-B1b TaxID=2705012 RepID=UPI0015FB9244|nr:STAS domain-containing protein [Streptacidiphilus sp. PB12-B1b]QMU77084.1 STAS domain-containing protein [Streptacidiphilus sp. PB12-B1b]
MPCDLTATVQQAQGTHAVVAVGGSMDFDSAGSLHDVLVELIDEGRRHLVLEMSQVGFCDSSGLNVLLQVLRRAQAEQGSLALVSATEAVGRVLEITAVDTVIAQYPSVAAALAGSPG